MQLKMEHDLPILDSPSEQGALIRKIEGYGACYDPDCDLPLEDQLLACETVAESNPVDEEHYKAEDTTNKNGSVNGTSNGTCKRIVAFELTQSKQKAIDELTRCTYKTHPVEIAELLGTFFEEWESKQGHWLYVAQHRTPRIIVRTLRELTKLLTSGRATTDCPPRYFTYLLKFRAARKEKQRPIVSANKTP